MSGGDGVVVTALEKADERPPDKKEGEEGGEDEEGSGGAGEAMETN